MLSTFDLKPIKRAALLSATGVCCVRLRMRIVAGLLIAGTMIDCMIIAGTFFSNRQPESFLWVARCFCAVWLIALWRGHLAELRRRKGNR